MGRLFNPYAFKNTAELRNAEEYWTLEELESFFELAKVREATHITFEKCREGDLYGFSGLKAWKKETEQEKILAQIAEKESELERLKSKVL
jgi:hypothetical protein